MQTETLIPAQLQATWRGYIAAANGKPNRRLRAATRHACNKGLRPGHPAWYAAAINYYRTH